jgi:glycosyltransferase 2 family protein
MVGFVSSPVSFDAVLAFFLGWMAGAAVLVVAGAPSRRPTRSAVMTGLGAVGLPVVQLDRAGVDARGSTPYFGVGADGSRLFVKALGADERSADLLFRLYRRIQRHNFGDEPSFSTLRRAVEHEAFVALSVRAMGVRTPALRAFATAEPNGYVLAYEAIEGRSLDRLDPSEVTNDVLASVWHLVGELRQHRVAHRDLRLANIFLDDSGAVWLIDFGFSEVAASDVLLATDVAELLASSSVYVGADRAVAQAVTAVDPATLGRAVDRLHPWALSGATRTALAERPGQLDDLRAQLSRAADAGARDGR